MTNETPKPSTFDPAHYATSGDIANLARLIKDVLGTPKAIPPKNNEATRIIQTGTKQEKGKNPEPIIVSVPADQAWLYHILNEQKKVLDKINNGIVFIVVIIILGIIISVLRACTGI